MPTHAEVFKNTAVMLSDVARLLEQHEEHPYGPPVDRDTQQAAGMACQRLCGEAGKSEYPKALELWEILKVACGGYMPQIVAHSLTVAADADFIVVSPEGPEPQ